METPSYAAKTVDWRRIANLVGLILLIAAVGLFLVASVPGFVGADESYVVLSDSMSPTIKAGAVVFVSDVPAERIQKGDVITFRSGGDRGAPVTHRVVDVRSNAGERSFITKGDANEDPDGSPVQASAVIGTVAFHVPLMGYVVSFANTQVGLITLIVIPALVLIVLELRDFWRTTEADDDASGEDGTL